MNEPRIGRITWSPDYQSITKSMGEIIHIKPITIGMETDVIEKLLDLAFDYISRDWVKGDEGYDEVRDYLRGEFEKVLGAA